MALLSKEKKTTRYATFLKIYDEGALEAERKRRLWLLYFLDEDPIASFATKIHIEKSPSYSRPMISPGFFFVK